MENVFNRAMDTSDPIIPSINLNRRINCQHEANLLSEVNGMLSESPQLQFHEKKNESLSEGIGDISIDKIMSINELDT